jgi:hypothetical protein
MLPKSSLVSDREVENEKRHDPPRPAHPVPALRLVTPQREQVVLRLPT